jgi:metal-responsive CopG/Arc/MetJ family transcriptional regulator
VSKQVVSVRIDVGLADLLDRAARTFQISRSALAESVLEEFLTRDSATQKRLLHPRASRFRDKDPPIVRGEPPCMV